MEIKINKDIQKYEHKYAMGFNFRQMLWSVTAVVLDFALYLMLYDKVQGKVLTLLMSVVTVPCALLGFFRYHGMPAEKWLVTVIKNEVMMPEYLVFRAKNFYFDLHTKNMKEGKRYDFWKKKAGGRKSAHQTAGEGTGCSAAPEDME